MDDSFAVTTVPVTAIYLLHYMNRDYRMIQRTVCLKAVIVLNQIKNTMVDSKKNTAQSI